MTLPAARKSIKAMNHKGTKAQRHKGKEKRFFVLFGTVLK